MATRTATPTYANPLSSLDVPVAECPLHCDHCDGGHNTHFTHAGGGNNAAGQLHSECQAGSCTVHSCTDQFGGDGEMLADASANFVEAWKEFRNTSTQGLTRFVAEHPRYFVVNEERSALQVLDCSGQVFAHIPLGETELRTLKVGVTEASD